MANSISERVKYMWEHWNIRVAVQFSLALQILLIGLAPSRKWTSNKLVNLLVWSSYLLADATANFAVGLIFNGKSSPPDHVSPAENSKLLAFWAPFLLLHLGGPDTITAFALEDNQLWLRHLLAFIVRFATTGYVFFRNLRKNKVIIPTALLFLAGTIKYLERTYSLYLASKDKFRASMLRKPDPGINFAKFAEVVASKKPEELPEVKTENRREAMVTDAVTDFCLDIRKLEDLDVVQEAHKYFKIFKGLIVGIIYSFEQRDKSRHFFNSISAEDAFKVIAAELNFLYEVLYTKVVVVHSMLGMILRFISCSSVSAALATFHFYVKKHGFDRFDVKVTYALLLGAIGLDGVSILMAIFSNWTIVAVLESMPRPEDRSHWVLRLFSKFLILKRPKMYVCEPDKHTTLLTCIPFRSWSESVPGYNVIRYCLKQRPRKIHNVMHSIQRVICYLGIDKIANQCCVIINKVGQCINISSRKVIQFLFIHYQVYEYIEDNQVFEYIQAWFDKVIPCLNSFKKGLIDLVGLKDFLDELKYASSEPLTVELWAFIFSELQMKSWLIDDPETARKICSARGEWVLQRHGLDKNGSDLMAYVVDVTYDESVLMWHIATELLCNDKKGIDNCSNEREFSKILSDYMLYLLIMQPTMMAAVAGISKLRFEDTCADAKRFFKKRGIRPNNLKKACRLILEVNTEFKPAEVKRDGSLSVLFTASMLAKELRKLREQKWKILSQVWVEMLSYAASHCNATSHAVQLSKGGELVTFVWLLMSQFGVGNQFQSNYSLLLQG
ncbi:uncharacterized protein LOC110624902 isoform X1 [Manihot esculenta]|uniref:uncharacterized protein LOC110624902 isoform X1 n=1 Tax=Manihot esculenta TaxID=3983 RepID=UPI000B5D29CC|nr:uncharacterized protein LOC110624902 isoform X1 [Manihot esculenta]